MTRSRAAALLGALLCLLAVVGPGIGPAAAAAALPLTGYGTSSGGTVCDTVNEINPAYSDVACASGSSGFVGADGTTVGFGIVTAVDPRTSQNGGPLESTAYVIAIGVNGTQVATVGVDGKQVNGADYVYAKCFGNPALTYNKLVTTATTDGTFAVTAMPGTSYYRVEFVIPLSALAGCGITSSTTVQLYYGSSQAANLDVINKDFFRDGDSAVSFAGLEATTFGGSLVLTKTATPVSGPNPPGPGQTSTYDLAVTASDTSVYPLSGVQVVDDLPATVTLVSRSATAGTVTVTGQHVDWAGFGLAAGTSATLTLRVSITPTAGAVGSTFLLNAGANGAATRGDGVAVTASSNSVSTGVVTGPVLTLTKTAAPTFVAAGGTVGYTITLGNTGTATGSVTAVTDTLPAGFSFVAGSTGGTLSAPAPVVSGSTVTWNGPFSLPTASSRTLTFSAVAAGAGGSYPNTATATATNAATVSTGPTAAVTVNTPPSAQPDTAATARGTAVSINVLANDTDADANPLTVSAIGAPSNGTAVLDAATGRIVYTPGAGFNGTATFTYTVSDGFGGTSTATVTITVSNAAPVANADGLTAVPGVAVTVDVLANDTDPEGDPLTVTAVGVASHGAVTLSGGTVRYTADTSYVGADSFTYAISDGHGGTATGTVSVTIPNTAPTAANDGAATLVDNPVTVVVLANDTDPNAGQTLTVTAASTPTNGATTVNPDGTVTYTPTIGYAGPDSFTYTISDGAGGTALGTVNVTVTAGAPVAVDDSASTGTNAPVTIAVLTNDAGIGALSVVNLTQPVVTPPIGPPGGTAGTAVLNGNGTVTYTPTAGFTGTASFTYAVSDGAITSASPATVTITVLNAPPVAIDDTVPAASRAAAQPINVIANDTDANGDSLTITAVGTPSAGGAVTIDAGGGPGGTDRVLYSPTAGFTGTETFTYSVTDGRGGTSTATVTVTVLNADPVANGDSLTAVPGAAVPVDVLANDTDSDGDGLTVTALGVASHGTATLSGGAVSYTANTTYVGADSFTYTVSDGHGGTATGTVAVTIPNTAPTAGGDTASAVVGSSAVIAVLGNDTDPNTGQTLVVTAAGPAAHGTVVINPDGSITYTVTGNYQGADSFGYTISDGAGGTATATVSVTVSGRPPVAVDDAASTPTAAPVTVAVLSNDTDPDGDPLAVVAGSVTQPVVTVPIGPPGAPAGSAVLNPNGTITYTPPAGFSGTVAFQYDVTDGTSTSTATVKVTVANAAPIANDDNLSAVPSTPVPVDVLANDTDANGDTLTVTAVGPASHGTSTLSGGVVSYTAGPSYTGADSFTYTISDGRGGTATATVFVTVSGRAPVAVDDAATTPTGTAVTVTVLGNDTDPDGDTLAVVAGSVTTPVAGGVSTGSAVLNPNGTITFTPPVGFSGTVTFQYDVTDGTSTATATVTVAVIPAPAAPPVLVPPAPVVPPAAAPSPSPSPAAPVTDLPVNHPPTYTDATTNTTQDVLAGEPLAPLAATDPDGNALSYTLTSGNLPPGVHLQANGSFTGIATESGSYPVVLQVCDDGTPVLCNDTHLIIQVAVLAGPPTSPAPASASPFPSPPPPVVLPARVEPAPARPLLPRTGAPLAALVGLGLLSTATGAVVTRGARRRRST